tara:strand:- start:3742 stop:4149 length:408 start_codon:yes stop_codon:yes gene_type:complete
MFDSFEFRNPAFKSNVGFTFLIVILIGIILFIWNRNNNEKLELMQLYEQKVQDEIISKEKEISFYKTKIEYSKQRIQQLESKQRRYEHSLDSLDAIKNKTIILYREKIIKAKSFKSVEVLDYWKEKFYRGLKGKK